MRPRLVHLISQVLQDLTLYQDSFPKHFPLVLSVSDLLIQPSHDLFKGLDEATLFAEAALCLCAPDLRLKLEYLVGEVLFARHLRFLVPIEPITLFSLVRGFDLVHMKEDIGIRDSHFSYRTIHSHQLCLDLLYVVFERLLLLLLLDDQEVIYRKFFRVRGEDI